MARDSATALLRLTLPPPPPPPAAVCKAHVNRGIYAPPRQRCRCSTSAHWVRARAVMHAAGSNDRGDCCRRFDEDGEDEDWDS